jgi:hypothetical protein
MPEGNFGGVQPGGWPGLGKFMFVGMGIGERISLRHFSGKYREARAPQVRCGNLGPGLTFLSVGFAMPEGLRRYYGKGHLHFITFSCYRRLPLLKTVRARDIFVKELGKVREEMGFRLLGYVVMPEHVHLLISEPKQGTAGGEDVGVRDEFGMPDPSVLRVRV